MSDSWGGTPRIKARGAVLDPLNVDLELTITMSLAQWERVARAMHGHVSDYRIMELANTIDTFIENMKKQLHFEPTREEQENG